MAHAGAGPPTGGPVWALGLMSGTSMDGIDAAFVETDGQTITGFGPSAYLPYAEGDLSALPEVMADPHPFDRGDRADRLAAAETEVVRLHARAAVDLIAQGGLTPAVVGFPGQTVLHAPERRYTWQLGDGTRLAHALNRAVVWDFRSDDVAAGGQGAPLAPFYHHALARSFLPDRDDGPVAFLNIGGVGNVTWVDPTIADPATPGALVAFDTGPGNALINDWMERQTGATLDRGGCAAAAGLSAQSTSPEALEAALAGSGGALLARARSRLATNFVAEFLAKPSPKSLDRNDFATLLGRLDGWSTDAGAAALTAFTADCAAAAQAHLPKPPTRWYVCGGGRLNPVMMHLLARQLDGLVDPVDALGLDGDMLEAQAFAFLAVRVQRGLSTSAPGTTGCPVPVCGGRIAQP